MYVIIDRILLGSTILIAICLVESILTDSTFKENDEVIEK